MSDKIDAILTANPNAPTSDEFALALARKLYPPFAERIEKPTTFMFSEGLLSFEASEVEALDFCGEATRGLVDAVLVSSLISDDRKAEIDRLVTDSMPALENERTIGHFRFRWTEQSSDPRDNVAEEDIDATGQVLNDCWDRYSNEFRRPKAALIGGQRMIDVEVYFDAALYGSTSSHTNKIFLNSRDVVVDECRRQTTSAHELFHRVEYSYGYITGTAGQRWWVEALAAWSQKYAYPHQHDYVTRVNHGFDRPENQFFRRSYDACHYWKWLAERLRRAGAFDGEHKVIEAVLDEYSYNGNDARVACDVTLQNSAAPGFDSFFTVWATANFAKDFDDPSGNSDHDYSYQDNASVVTNCTRRYGPYKRVTPVIDQDVDKEGTSWTSPDLAVAAYATDYIQLRLDTAVSRVHLRFEGNLGGGAGLYGVSLVETREKRWLRIQSRVNTTDCEWTLQFGSSPPDGLQLVVSGLAGGGQYRVSVNP